jgi:uncharacterized membrane protein
MFDSIVVLASWLLILSVGVMAGVYFAFSTFVMRAFDDLPAAQAIAAMNSINRIIVKSMFLPLFFGSTVLALVQVVLNLMYWQGTPSYWAIAAGVVYLLSMFLCTALFNVPLNNRLAGFEQQSRNARKTWACYRRRWARWNHVRTIGSLLSVVLSVGFLNAI